MEQFHISLSSEDIDYFERVRTDLGMSKSSFVRLLIAQYKNSVPYFIQYKDIIEKQSELNNYVKQIVLDKHFNINDKMFLAEKFQELEELINNRIK